ncbi:bacillithiol biosynthesis cysteine-adding enzyme BshC [Virgibacillus litoralis]|uniref:Putative cysteine ligase BshC n=1 Tax=Virgibacillus litoralis TaxID=578221 RepID=A0ABS4HI63_9BACI|nr:bacillithiol biosynthesis cysteine-adding enzyme BshC [Virgibacillus litoralis]MBP1950617.1 bacillithiol biosynthesis cysteine-adding enzyme BshC [Virgibacillus litoralis]
MRIDPIKLQNQNALIDDYRNNRESITKHFEYNPYSDASYQSRLQALQNRNFDREQLTETLFEINQQWNAPESTYLNIERLKNDDSVVVIGGQQAGLLTGPMYTINKIISIIQFAKQQEFKLQKSVIPVFWIAGEDHDFDEINHIFLPETASMKKYKLLQRVLDKQSVSDISIDETYANQWMNRLFEQMDETQYTKKLYQTIKDCLENSCTYVDFFARVIYQLFDEEGVVLVDSGNPKMRRLERDHFLTLIENQTEISTGVYEALQQIKQKRYSVSLDVEPTDAHLFYHRNNERILLVRNENGDWEGKQNEVLLTDHEMINVARNNPELLSNNVVTRPIMQELLFPTLAFIGGPGEVGYWSILKPAFKAVGIKMPPVLPRLSFTFIDRNVEKAISKYAIDEEDAVNHGVEEIKGNWLASQSDPPVKQVASEIKQAVDKAHSPLRKIAKDTRSDLGELADKNLYYLQCDIEYLEDRIIKALEEKYKKELIEYDQIQIALRPNQGLQERTWNPLPLINDYGPYFIKQLAKESCSFEQEHHLIYI